jgi:hypothetical protein
MAVIAAALPSAAIGDDATRAENAQSQLQPGAIGIVRNMGLGWAPFALSRDGRFFTYGSTLWETATGRTVAEAQVLGGAAYLFSPLGAPWGVAPSDYSGTRIFEVKGNSTLATVPGRDPLVASMRACGGGDGVLLICPVSRDDGVVEVWDLARTPRPARILRLANRDLYTDVCSQYAQRWLAVSENGRRLFWLNAARTITVWDLRAPGKGPLSIPWDSERPAEKRKEYSPIQRNERPEKEHTLGASAKGGPVAPSPDPAPQPPDAIVASPDGETVLGLEYEPSHPETPIISLWGAASGTRYCVLRPAPWRLSEHSCFAFSPHGGEFMILRYHASVSPEMMNDPFFRIEVWDINSAKCLREYSIAGRADFLPILESADVYMLAWTQYRSVRRLSRFEWDGYSGRVLQMPPWPRIDALGILPIVSPDGLFFVDYGAHSTLHEVASGKRITQLTQKFSAYPVAFSADGNAMITESGPHERTCVTFWSVPRLLGRERLPATDEATLLAALLGDDPARAQAAASELAAKGDGTVRTLQKLVIARPSHERIQDLVRQLDAETLDARRVASDELARYGESVEKDLERAARKGGTSEVHRRAADLLSQMRLNMQRFSTPELRAVQVLAAIRSPRAIAALRGIAENAARGRIRAAAFFSLARLDATSGSDGRR